MFGKLAIHNTVIMILSVQFSSADNRENCTCRYYLEYEYVGPYCCKWTEDESPFCYLAGREKAKNCPGAIKIDQDNVYWTEDELVDSRLKQQRSFEFFFFHLICL